MTRHRTAWAALAMVSGLLSVAPASAQQYIWLDEKGTRQYSDVPPPPSTPASRIIRSGPLVPRKETAPEIPPATAATATAPAAGTVAATTPGPMTVAERNADFNRRKVEREEQEKKAAEQAKKEQDRAKNCSRAREYRQVLDSGQRVVTTDGNGERSFMSDEQRSREARETSRILAECK